MFKPRSIISPIMRLPFVKKGPAAIDAFWTWFQSPDGQKTLNELWVDGATSNEATIKVGQRLKAVDNGLSWGATPDRFEVSASGIRDNMPIVRAIVERAPKMPNWEVIAFKQPLENPELMFQGHTVAVDTIMCQILGNRGPMVHLDVYLPLPVGTPQCVLNEMGFIMLDHTLGEETVMTRLGALRFDFTLVAPSTVMTLRELAASLNSHK